MLFRLLTGLGLGAAMPNVGTLVAEFAPARRRAFLITVVFCGFTFGAAFGGFAASWLMPRFGWHAVLLLGGVLPVLFVPFVGRGVTRIGLLPGSETGSKWRHSADFGETGARARSSAQHRHAAPRQTRPARIPSN